MTALVDYGSEENNLLFCPHPDISSSFLARDILSKEETKAIFVSENSPLLRVLRESSQDNSGFDFSVLDVFGSNLIDEPIFFDDPNPMAVRRTIENLFLFKEDLDYGDVKTVRGILQAVVRYIRLRTGKISIRDICDTAKLFFDRPLGDEEEYANRLDEILESYGTGIHVDKGERHLIPDSSCDEELRRYWRPIRRIFDNPYEATQAALKLRAVIDPYEDYGHESGILDKKLASPIGNGKTLVIQTNSLDSSRDGLVVAFLDQLIHVSAKQTAFKSYVQPVDRVVFENADDQARIPAFASLVRSSCSIGLKFSVCFSSFVSFCNKYAHCVDEVMASFDNLVFLSPTDPAAFKELNSRVGISFREFSEKGRHGGWSINSKQGTRYVTWSQVNGSLREESGLAEKGN